MSPRLHASMRKGGPARFALALALGLALTGAGADARAADQPRAEELFERGRKLMQSRATLAEACRTLEESLTYMDRGDTWLNLAECHRRQGKTATAWAEFDRALTHGTKVGFAEAIRAATLLRDQIAAKLSRLTVAIPPTIAALEGLTVEVEGKALPRERWNTAFVIDPGPTQVTARARGYKPFEIRVEIGADKDVKTVVVALEVEPAPLPPPPLLLPPGPRATQPRPVWPWIVGGVGVALGAAALGSELVSLAAHRELDKNCGPARQSCMGYPFGPVRTREVVGFGLFLGLGAGGLLALGAAGVGLGIPLRVLGTVTHDPPAAAPASLGPRAAPRPARGEAPSLSLVLSPTAIGVRGTF